MKCTVLGGGGFIGSAVVDRLLQDGHEVRVFERPRIPPYRTIRPEEKFTWLTGDLQSTTDVGNAIDGVDCIVHLVSTTLPKGSNDDPIYDVQSNIVATLQLLQLMVARKVPRIVFISSGGTVYGTPEYLPIDEKHRTEPRVSYGITKLAVEKYLLLFQSLHGIRSLILRVSNPYGLRQRVDTAQGAVAAFLHRAIRKETLSVWGDGSITRDYLFVSDVADAFSRALVYDGHESVFNISSGKGKTLNELIAAIEATLGRPVAREYLPGRPFDVGASVLDNTLARKELHWIPEVGLEAGLAQTADWMQRILQQPDRRRG